MNPMAVMAGIGRSLRMMGIIVGIRLGAIASTMNEFPNISAFTLL